MNNRHQIAEKVFLVSMMLHHKLMRPVIHQSKFDFSPLQLHVLGTLKDNKSVTMTMLANEIRISKQQLTRLIDNFVTQGLVQRESDNQDRRIIKISLTETGLARFANIETEGHLALTAELELFDDQKMAELNAAADKLIKLLKELP